MRCVLEGRLISQTMKSKNVQCLEHREKDHLEKLRVYLRREESQGHPN